MERIDVLRRLWELREAGVGKAERIETVEAERSECGNAEPTPEQGFDFDMGASPPAWATGDADELDLDILG